MFYFIKQTKLNYFFQTKDNLLNVQIFPNLQNHPIFHSEERLVNVERGRECFCLSIFIISLWFKCFNILDAETLTGGLEKAKYYKDVTKIFQDVTKIFQDMSPKYSKMSPKYSKMSPKYSKDVTKILHFSAHKNIYVLVLLHAKFQLYEFSTKKT